MVVVVWGCVVACVFGGSVCGCVCDVSGLFVCACDYVDVLLVCVCVLVVCCLVVCVVLLCVEFVCGCGL